ncbi:MAG: ABC transporter ATP-binding protein [Acidobacteriota bacterium]|nr:MAG: ABC transporter ATP-binding protein [Acidobacteriota bacterium]
MESLSLQIQKSFPGFRLDVKLEVGTGIHALFGPSGVGKTQTLECISGLTRPDRGLIRLGERVLFRELPGQPRIDLKPRSRQIGYVVQDGALFPHKTLLENVCYPLEKRGLEPLDKARSLLSEMGLGHLGNRLPSEVSGGQKRRAAIARALAFEPSLLLLDEPFVHLDQVVLTKLMNDLAQTVSHHRIITLLVTHDLDVAARIAETIWLMDRGEIIQSGTTSDVLFKPATGEIARLLGNVNLLEGSVLDERSGVWRVRTSEIVWQVPHMGNLERGQKVELMIRTGAVKIVKPGVELPTSLGLNLQQATVQSVDKRPDLSFVVFDLLEGLSLTGRVPTDSWDRTGLRAGARCQIAVSIDGLALFEPSALT